MEQDIKERKNTPLIITDITLFILSARETSGVFPHFLLVTQKLNFYILRFLYLSIILNR